MSINLCFNLKESLKPCPVCNNSVRMNMTALWHDTHGYHGKYSYELKCPTCGCTWNGCKSDDIYKSSQEAIDFVTHNWNNRTCTK